MISSKDPLLGNPGRTPLPEKKLSAHPNIDGLRVSQMASNYTFINGHQLTSITDLIILALLGIEHQWNLHSFILNICD